MTLHRWMLALITMMIMTTALAQQGAQSKIIYAQDGQGQKHKIRAFVYKNDWNRTEVRIETADIPRISPGVNQVLGYGRDFDDDGKIETWFMYSDEKGFVRYMLPGSHPYGFDVLEHKLFKSYSTTTLAKINVLASHLMSFLSLAASRVVNSQLNFFKEMLDLEEINVRLSRSQGMSLERLSPAQLGRMKLLLNEGYRRSFEILKRANNQEFVGLVAADIALWFTGAIVVKYIGKGLKVAGTMVLKTTAGAALKNLVSSMLVKTMGFIALNMTKIQKGISGIISVAQINAVKAISHLGLKNSLRFIGQGLGVRNSVARVGKLIIQAKNKIGTRWTFTAASIGTSMWGDLRAESVRKEEHSRLIQSLVYSLQVQNDLLSCVHGKQQSKGSELDYKLAGFINVKNHEVLLMKDQGYADIALNIGTKLTIDSAKETVDGIALNYIENIVTETNQPKLQLIGYMVIMANEASTGSMKRKLQSQPFLCPVKLEAN